MSKKFYIVLVVLTIVAMLLSACEWDRHDGTNKIINDDNLQDTGEAIMDDIHEKKESNIMGVLRAIEASDGQCDSCGE